MARSHFADHPNGATMIKHLRHSAIDKSWWNERIAASQSPLWYARSAVLDAASPGWEALVDETSQAVMPLTQDSKWGISYLYQPFAVQRLGVFSGSPNEEETTAFLRAIPSKYKVCDIYLNAVAPTGQIGDVLLEERHSLELDLSPELAVLRAAYSENHRRGLRKWKSDGELKTISPETFLKIVRGSEQFEHWGITPKQEEALARIVAVAASLGDGRFLGLERDGEWLAVAFFVEWAGRIIFMKGLSTKAGRGVSALHRILDDMIASRAGRPMVLDMAGGNAPQLRRFYTGFGAQPRLYLHAGYNRLPQPLRWIKERRDGI